MPPQQQSASHRIRRIHRTVCRGWSPTDFTDLHRWLGAEDSSGGILASAAAKCLPQNTQNSQNRLLGMVSHRFHRFTQMVRVRRFSHRIHRIHRTCYSQGVHLSQVHQPSKQWSSHRFHRSTQKLLILGWCTSYSVGALLTRLVHLRQVNPLEGTQTICVDL